ncbi:hypothetical protein KC19_3G073700 [Ceratodon purpureus]|uniref:Protein kinase domain-containing protein n=1 Tax=Ceratodon purpureus TaxID=3225 RepID=A0A8T0IFX4_CERPU|nr:hypothetical protein KC19_3G073700 [Ceratodon purpureus]
MATSVELESPDMEMERVDMASKIVGRDGSISNKSPSASSVGDLEEELICQVSQALQVIDNVCNISSTVWVNKHQCKRMADRFSAIGNELKALGFDKGDFVCEKSLSNGGSSKGILPAIDKLLVILQRGEALILYFREWEGIIRVVSGPDCRSGEFKEIHEELDTMQGFEPTLEFGTALVTADAEKDMEEMSKMLERAALDSDITSLDSFVTSASSGWNNSYVGEQQLENHPVSISSHLRINPSDIRKGRRIGRGASAVVYEATWLGCKCAVKRFLAAYSRTWVLELQQELKFLSNLRHPHIVRLIGLSVDSQQRCSIVMEWMEYSLRDLIDCQMQANRSIMEIENIDVAPSVVPFKFSEALDIITKIALGLWFLHTEGVAHRDVKSPNVLVRYFGSSNQQIKIVDFGASRHVDSNTMHAVIGVGTGFWRAPEILPTETVGNLSTPDLMAADVYSFAMTRYEVLTGKLPFQDELSTGRLRYNEYGTVISGLRPELPDNLDGNLKGLINSCWDRDPSHRPNFEKICKELVYFKSQMNAIPANKSLRNHEHWRSVLLHVCKKVIHRVHLVNQGKEYTLSSSHKVINLDSLSMKNRLERSNSSLLLPEHMRIEPSQLVKVRNILQGSNAKFYEATWLGSSVVVKKLIFGGSSYGEQQREVDFLIKLSRHPYIAQLVGLSIDAKQQFLIVMEMMNGSLL